VAVILVYPVLYGVFQSLFRAEFFGGEESFVGLQNYIDVMASDEFWHSVNRSAIFVFGCIVVGITLGTFFAFALNRVVSRLRFIRAVSIAPYLLSNVAAAVMFRLVFNSEFGILNQTLQFFGLDGPSWLADPTLAMAVVIFAQVWTDLPLTMLLILGGLQTIDQAYMDAALVDGATGWTRARTIVFPLIAPQIVISVVWLSYSTLTGLGVVLALTGGGPFGATRTLPMMMYETAFDDLEMHQALAIATIVLVLNAVLTVFYTWVSRRFGASE
jgi:ABC-type sugar transport system permease subunit